MKNQPAEYLSTRVLTILLALVSAMVIGQTVMQLSIGVHLSPGQMIGKVATWVIMGGIAVWLSITFLRNLSNSAIAAKY